MVEAIGQIEQPGRVEAPNLPVSSQPFKPEVRLGRRKTPFSRSVLTREKQIPGTETDRGLITRFERAEITRAYHLLRKPIDDLTKIAAVEFASGQDESGFKALEEKLGHKEFLVRFRREAQKLEADLDTLNRQFYESERRVPVTDSEGRTHEVSVITLDLNPPKREEKDPRIPVVRIPSFLSNAHNDAALSMALALAGHKVVIPTFSENPMSVAPKGWLDTLKKDGTFRPTAEIMEKVIQELGIEEFDLYGTSRGAAVALQMVIDLSAGVKNSKLKIRKLIAIEPPGIISKRTLKQLFDFGVVEGIRSTVNAENRIKSVISQPFPTVSEPVSPITLAPSLSRQQFTLEDLAGISAVGEFQVWLGGKSAITGSKALETVMKARELRLIRRPNGSALKVVVVDEVGHDFPFVLSAGVVAHSIGENTSSKGIIHLNPEDLANSGADNLLRRMAA